MKKNTTLTIMLPHLAPLLTSIRLKIVKHLLLLLFIHFLFKTSVLSQDYLFEPYEIINKSTPEATISLENSDLKISFNNKKTPFIIEDSMKVFSKANKINLYSIPINPLKYKVTADSKITDDEQYVKVQDALATIIGYLSLLEKTESATNESGSSSTNMAALTGSNDILKKLKEGSDSKALNKLYFSIVLSDSIDSCIFNKKTKNIDAITSVENLNQFDYKDSISNLIIQLTQLDLSSDDFKQKFNSLKNNLNNLKVKKNTLENETKELDNISFECSKKYSDYLKDILQEYKNDITSRIKIINTSINQTDSLLNSFEKFADKLKKDNGQVYSSIKELNFEDEKINYTTITYYENTFQINKTGEIKIEEKEIHKKTIVFRKYKLLSAQVMPGFLYSNLKFNSYTTTSDTLGNTIIAEGTPDILNKIKFSAMINFTFHFEGYDALPFLQLGVGPSKETPALFTGGGINLRNKLCISFGGAWPLLKQLNTLSIGDKVTGMKEIEDDLKFKFSTTPAFYIGFQFKI